MPNVPTLEEAYTTLDSLEVKVAPCQFEELTALSTPKGLLAIDYRKISTRQQELEILLHEIGHFSTATFYQWDTPYTLRQKQEHKAIRFVFEKYYPPLLLAQAFHQGHTETWELAEYFSLPQSFIVEMLSFYREVRNINFNGLVASLQSAPPQEAPPAPPMAQPLVPASETPPSHLPSYLLAIEEELRQFSQEIDQKNQIYQDNLTRYQQATRTQSGR